jgi:hypothetical protein
VRVLGKDPQNRQAVIAMWDPTVPHPEGGGAQDLTGSWRDRPCNTHIYLRVRMDRVNRVLDMTVCCRSNDIIWGAYGANAVHFSVLQEYLAVRLGVQVGRMYQVSNNYHAYLSEIERLTLRANKFTLSMPLALEPDEATAPAASPLFRAGGDPDREVDETIRCLEVIHEAESIAALTSLRWDGGGRLGGTVLRAAVAHRAYRLGEVGRAVQLAGDIHAEDWRRACVEWLARRA